MVKHGTEHAYKYYKCRCDDCRAAVAKAVRERGHRAGRHRPMAERRLPPEELLRRRRSENRIRRKQRADENTPLLNEMKRLRGCVDCGTQEGILEFDHRDPKTKSFSIGPRKHFSMSRLLAEIEKCDVRCKSCHSRRHGILRGGLNGPKR